MRRSLARRAIAFTSASVGRRSVSRSVSRTHLVHRLLDRRIRHRKNRYESAAVGFCTKHDMAFDLGEQGMIGTHADIKAGMPGGAALTRNDVAGNHMLAAVGLDPEPLARRITSVTR